MKKQTEGRKITVYSLKGGQGKTSVSVNLALEEDYGIITNDYYSPIELVLPEERYLKLRPEDDLPSAEDLNGARIIFDCGGYLDSRVIPALEMSSWVIIPIAEYDTLCGKGLIDTIREVSPYNNNIIILLNKVGGDMVGAIKKELERNQYLYPIFEIKPSKVMQQIFTKRKSISEITKEEILNKRQFQLVEAQFQKLINFLNK